MKFQREMRELQRTQHVPTGKWVDWQCSETDFSLDERNRCQSDAELILCDCAELRANNRLVRYSLPSHSDLDDGDGIPVVMVFHGWAMRSISTFRTEDDYWCRSNKVGATQALLDAGYAVFAPSASAVGDDTDGGEHAYWLTSMPGYDTLDNWTQSSDHKMLIDLWSQLARGLHGYKFNLNKMHATGFSNGGMMASRMGFSYPGMFNSLTNLAGSYYNCDALCERGLTEFEKKVLDLHPANQILHGAEDYDVPASASVDYDRELSRRDWIPNRRIVKQGVGHRWLDEAPELILDWISRHN